MLMVLIGLPGSGESTLADEHGAVSPDVRVYKDFLGFHRPLTEGYGLFSLLADVRAGRTVFADDIFLCRPADRSIFETILAPFIPKGYPVQWRYFTNSPEVCRKNVELRDRRHRDPKRRQDALGWIQKLTPLYIIPDGIEPIPVVEHGA